MADELIVETSEQLRECCNHLAACPVIGFDSEFVGEQTFVPDLCLLQVATPDRLFLIDPFRAGPLDEFWRLIGAAGRTVVVHAAREEIRLYHRATGLRPGNFFDLQIAAGLIGLDYPLGHGALVRQLLNLRLHKGETLTDWRKRPLSPHQIEYAFDDVGHVLAIWEILSERIERLGRMEWEREEVDRLMRRSLGEEPGVERWRKLRGVGSLERKKLAAVQALYEWRERKATERNRPVRTILRDDLIIEIARRTPRSPDDVEMLRGVPKRDAPELFRIVTAARAMPEQQWPKSTPADEDEPHVALVAGLMQVVLGDQCARSQLAASLVASVSDVRQLVRSAAAATPLPADSPFASGWRASAILPALESVLRGQRRLRIATLRQSSPFEYGE